VNHAASATVRRFPSIVGALIIAASILLSALMFAAGTRFTATALYCDVSDEIMRNAVELV